MISITRRLSSRVFLCGNFVHIVHFSMSDVRNDANAAKAFWQTTSWSQSTS